MFEMDDRRMFENKGSMQYRKEISKIQNMKFPEFVWLNKNGSYCKKLTYIMENVQIEIDSDNRFIYFIDMRLIPDNFRGVVFDNISLDYRKIIQFGLEELKYKQEECTNKFTEDYNQVINALILLSKRIYLELLQRNDERTNWFSNMIQKKADSFEEAVQRILFLNMILWQTNHPLMGFGLLDTILEEVYEKDKECGIQNKDKVMCPIMDFYRTLHKYYWYKSHALVGDTGQLIIVGRTDFEGNYHYNDLTYCFIDGIKKLQFPDPKVLLRVSKDTPRDLMNCAMECIATGVGCPVLANDDVIIPKLIKNGIDQKDAYDYATAACWEPLIAWKCPFSNNLTVLNYMKSMENMFIREPLEKIDSFDSFVERYLFYLKHNLKAVKNSLWNRRFAYDPLVSIFIGNCKERKKDVSAGGAVYNDYGMTTIALGNVINAMCNIKEYVFEKKVYTLQEIRNILLTDFDKEEDLIEMLKRNPDKYGTDSHLALDLTNKIIDITCQNTLDFTNYMGGKLKFGLSSPAYVDVGKGSMASFDGRKKGEPFCVHISSPNAEAYTELVNFATSIELKENSYNGNVVDFITTPSFISENLVKFVDFVYGGIEKGFFEMQIGVTSSDMLISAREHPEKFPNLIVRVWGFSAYFNDLPEDYKNVIIKRALENEGKSA